MAEESESSSLVVSLISGIFSSPVNFFLTVVIAYIAYKFFNAKQREYEPVEVPPELPKLRRDFTLQELKPYDGTGPDGRVLMAVNGKVFDMTRGKRFYGPGGPYAVFAGRDASRGLATFSLESPKEGEYDDLSDLSKMEMDSVREWEEQFQEKYDYVGKLLRPGEQPSSYPEEESSL